MNVGNSVRKALDDFGQGETESAMLHACNAADGTASKVYLDMRRKKNKERFTRLLRENYAILGPMGMPGINVVETRFQIVAIKGPTAPGGTPDLADVIYGIHRCTHGHGDELSAGFELMPNAAGQPGYTSVQIVRNGAIRLSDRIIFGLLAVAVLAPVNKGQRVPDGYWLSLGDVKLVINDWWGRASDFPAIVAAQPPMPNITVDFSAWTSGTAPSVQPAP
jgi:hypothetical protein